MVYFSRLTDIVTCNLSEILANEADPKVALEQVIREMEEGLSGAKRSVETATKSENRIAREIEEHRSQIDHWKEKAKSLLQAGNEEEARQALMRKQETADVIAGLEQQHQAAIATREHLSTTTRALQARLSDAHRKQKEIAGQEGEIAEIGSSPQTGKSSSESNLIEDRSQQIDDELEMLKKELSE